MGGDTVSLTDRTTPREIVLAVATVLFLVIAGLMISMSKAPVLPHFAWKGAAYANNQRHSELYRCILGTRAAEKQEP